MHKTLKRQLTRFYGSLGNVPSDLKPFWELVSKTYTDNDSEYTLMERALDISSKELTEANKLLREENEEIEKRVIERTAELSQERSKLNKIAQNMKTGAILLDEEAQVTFINNKAREIVDLEDGDKDSEVLDKLFLKFKKIPLRGYLERCMRGDTVEVPEIEAGYSIYEIFFQSLESEKLGKKSGKQSYFGHLIWIRDITEEKLLERSKSELVAVASHQLRTPLTVTKGNTEMLLDGSLGDLSDEQREVISQTSESNEQLITLVNQMLDITRIEKDGLAMDLENVSTDKILQKVIRDILSFAEKNNVSIKYSKQGEIPEISGNKERLYQVFQNLVENAIKYCKNDKDKVCPVTVSTSSSGGFVNIEIADRGIGVPKQEQEKIFERFYRASNAVRFKSSGTGLGLYIVKSVIENLGGNVRFESEEGKGTTFFISLPVAIENDMN
jgi:two-component system, OmpR family, phosphate regulon sensor histidine kinase PhoR